MWYPSMQYERYYVITDDNEDASGQKRRFKMWVTDAIYMPNCQKIAITSTSRDIRFFDTSTSQYFEEYHLFGKYNCEMAFLSNVDNTSLNIHIHV